MGRDCSGDCGNAVVRTTVGSTEKDYCKGDDCGGFCGVATVRDDLYVLLS